MNFGFWNSLYETHHYALLKGVPCTIFRSLPTGIGRKEVNQRVQQIRVMRNRISHNEPLCFNDKQYDMAYVNEMYAMIRDFLAWIDPKILASLGKENLDNVLAEIAETEKIMMGV